MILQKMCAVMGGYIDPVRRKRYEQWNPKSVVYASWNTIITG